MSQYALAELLRNNCILVWKYYVQVNTPEVEEMKDKLIIEYMFHCVTLLFLYSFLDRPESERSLSNIEMSRFKSNSAANTRSQK